ncbi:MAG: DUF1700 domain-containing protein [Sphingomonadaceae bacterium]
MSKQEYLTALRQAMTGLPPETVASTLADYEQRFIDGLTAGRSEAEIAQGLDEPRKVAMGLRASIHLHAFTERKTPTNLARMLVSLIGLAIFNLFMVIPAMVYAALLLTMYLCAFTFYIGGVAVTASALSGQTEVALQGPLRQLILHADGDGDGSDDPSMEARMTISSMGVQLFKEPSAPPAEDGGGSGKLLERAEAVANGDLHITSDYDNRSRTSQGFIGMGLVLAGIALCLLSLVVTRYTLVGIKRYVAMNLSLLRGH